MSLDLTNKGVSLHWRNGDLVILYDKQIWNVYCDEETSQICLYKPGIKSPEAVVIPNDIPQKESTK